MKSASFGNFQVGQVANPSIEDKGGFEFASGMDIFGDPGVLKASFALAEVAYGTGAAPTAVPYAMDTYADGSGLKSYIAVGSKLLESIDNGQTWNTFITDANGSILGMKIWNTYVMYASLDKLGRVLVGNAGSKNDSYATIDADDEFHPMVQQGGTLKIGAGRYVASLNEAFTLTSQAMKLPVGYRVRCLVEHFTNLFVGTQPLNPLAQDASVFAWRGTVLSSGSALPDTPYPIKLRGMNALLSDGRKLYGFPDFHGDILQFDGVGFAEYRKLYPMLVADGTLFIKPNAVAQGIDNIVLFGGNGFKFPGIYAMKDGAICQAYVPSTFTPGDSTSVITVGLVNTSINGNLIIGYYNANDASYHIEKVTGNRQNNAMVKTLWHRIKTDKLKRWGGIKLNLKPMGGNTSIAVAYRTSRDASFTDSGYTITSANQDKPIIFSAQPRSRDIQFKLTYTTNAGSTPELLSYDPLFEVLNTNR